MVTSRFYFNIAKPAPPKPPKPRKPRKISAERRVLWANVRALVKLLRDPTY